VKGEKQMLTNEERKEIARVEESFRAEFDSVMEDLPEAVRIVLNFCHEQPNIAWRTFSRKLLCHKYFQFVCWETVVRVDKGEKLDKALVDSYLMWSQI
jgi:adenine-specific DNA methylase